MSIRSRVPPPRSLARPPESSSGRRGPPTGFCGGSGARREGGHAQPARSNGLTAARLTNAEKSPPPAQQRVRVAAHTGRPHTLRHKVAKKPPNWLNRCPILANHQPGHDAIRGHGKTPTGAAARDNVTVDTIEMTHVASIVPLRSVHSTTPHELVPVTRVSCRSPVNWMGPLPQDHPHQP
jgi:hypothetical protein